MDLEIIILCAVAVTGLILFLPIKGAGSFKYHPPSRRFHEADAVLSRRLLNPGTEAYNSYYQLHPESRDQDDRSRRAPGLLSRNARSYHPGTFAAAKANFEIIDFLGSLTHATPSALEQEKINPKKISRFITRWLKRTGAHSVGFTHLKEYHLYSHKGRGTQSGEPIKHSHQNAIAITVEMD
ncbi:MAG: hypothetical protein KAT15_17220, partial [Bacteroidales bacterium]|nr:hypothetical protein [Bacteroidales bacterium]